ncbi:hypothetical protein V1477_013653 [Vespula maculifrons]|uniref:Uncharacterized protein n=1 Tax=Vespula maculifrons TaxID=7453 RepID=A0ABD2BNW4_VESMC
MKQKRKKKSRRKGSDASRKVGASKASKDEPGAARKEDSERTIQEEEEDEDDEDDEDEEEGKEEDEEGGKGEEEEEEKGGGGGDKEKDEEELEKGEEEEEDSASSFSERPTLLLIMQEIRFNLLLFVFIPCGSIYALLRLFLLNLLKNLAHIKVPNEVVEVEEEKTFCSFRRNILSLTKIAFHDGAPVMQACIRCPRGTYRRQDQEDGRPTLDSLITESLFHKKRSISSLRKDSYLRIALGSRYISTPISMVRVFSKEGKSKEKSCDLQISPRCFIEIS